MTNMVGTISELVVVQQQLARQAEQLYYVEVEAILRDKCRDPWHMWDEEEDYKNGVEV